MNPLDSIKKSWREGIEPDLWQEVALSASESSTTAVEELLVTAICEDMRFRWVENLGGKKITQNYINEMPPQLGPLSTAALVRLTAHEWELRTNANDPDATEACVASLPDLRSELGTAILSTNTYQNLPPEQQIQIRNSWLPALREPIVDVFQTIDPGLAAAESDKSAFDTQPTRSSLLSTQLPHPADQQSDGEGERRRQAQATHLGRYQLIRKLGSGAFGDVFLGFDDKLDRHVAIKVPRRQFLERSGGVDSFLAEARAAAKMDHPGIVTTHDVIEEPDGTVLIVMEFIDGGTLQDLIDQSADKGPVIQRMGLNFVASVGYQVAMALAEAHHHNLIHRDLKPANLMLKDDKLRVTDFGLAVTASETNKGYEVAGTPAYMSPEQIDSTSSGLDGRSDIWSLGVILYQLATGKLPFEGNLKEVLGKIPNEQPVSPRSINRKVPEQLESIIARCLEKNRNERFQSVLELADELRPLTVPKPPGFRWECVTLPLGIILTIAGVPLGIAYTINLLYLYQFFDTWTLVTYGIESFTVVGLTLGIGPPLIALGNWFCCRRCNALSSNAPTIPCKVSRWALACIASGTATAGFGLPMYVLTVGLAVAGFISIRKKKRWLTGNRHIVAGLVLGFLLLLPWMFYWSCFTQVYRFVASRESFDQAIARNDLATADVILEEIIESSSAFAVRGNGGRYIASVYEARLAISKKEYKQAIDVTENANQSIFINNSIRLSVHIVRAIAYLREDKDWELASEKNMILNSLETNQFPLPAWAQEMLEELQPLELESGSVPNWNDGETFAPLPPRPIEDPSA